jgi:hypothetical protein
MAAIAGQSTTPSNQPRTTRPISAAKTGLTLMKTPKNLAGTRRSVIRAALGPAPEGHPW